MQAKGCLEWEKAMEDGLDALEKNNTWEVVDLHQEKSQSAVSPSQLHIDKVKRFLHSAFTIKDLGPAKYFLSLEIARSAAGLSVTQHKYIRDIILDTGLQDFKPAHTPLPMGLKLSVQDAAPLPDPEPYRRLVG
ncbi:UNVERIFIED_CONTAM: hypothetical protein Slati_0798800 [Sesamum latifolium]|uniref:Reverse transcriptase Ty1/copia-type domain-containing protein n=1 Tax=Sesamum latifolium TaxID=2727402 RepID=A0AAW2XLH5_9LAMI